MREVRLNHDIRAPVVGAPHPIQDEDGVEYDFSQLQSDLFVSFCGKSDQDSTEVGLLVNFLSLHHFHRAYEEVVITGKIWVPDVINLLKKLKIF